MNPPPANRTIGAARIAAQIGIQRLLRLGSRARSVLARQNHGPSANALNNEMIRAAAVKLGIVAEPLPGDFTRLSLDGRTRFSHASDFPFESLVPWQLCGDKPMTSMILAERGLPVPPSRTFGMSEYEHAVKYLERSSGPLVAKPARGTAGGEAVTLNITTPGELRPAFVRAAAVSSDVLIETQVPGENVRITVLDGEVVGIVHRLPAHVVGNGREPIATLVSAKNELWRSHGPSNRLLKPIQIDAGLKRVLRRQGLALDEVPPSGTIVQLREVDQGGQVEDIADRLHPEHIELALRAADALGPVMSGVDLIVEDLESATPGGVVVNEVNTTPALYVANAMVDGSPSTYAAERALRHLFSLDA